MQAAVSNHEVSLTGSVTWAYERDRIRSAVAALPLVTAVHDDISVNPPAMITKAALREMVTSELVATAKADGDRIELTIRGTEVTLTGRVSSHDARRQVKRAVGAASGVTFVDDRLGVTARALATESFPSVP